MNSKVTPEEVQSMISHGLRDLGLDHKVSGLEQQEFREDQPINGFFSKIALNGSCDVFIFPSEVQKYFVFSSGELNERLVSESGESLIIGGCQQSSVTITNHGQRSVTNHGQYAVGQIFNNVNIGLSVTGDVYCGDFRNLSSVSVNDKFLAPVIALFLKGMPELSVAGSGSFYLPDLHSVSLDVNIMGSGSVLSKGIVDEATIHIAGSGSAILRDTVCNMANLIVSGSGSIYANAGASIDATVVGSGSIILDGEPKVMNRTVVGSGKIFCR